MTATDIIGVVCFVILGPGSLLLLAWAAGMYEGANAGNNFALDPWWLGRRPLAWLRRLERRRLPSARVVRR
jgi:hypothetical protein